MHKLLDTVTDHVREFADLAAERTIALGLPIDAHIQTVATKNTLPPMQAGFQNYGLTMEQVVAQIDAAIVTVRAAVDGLNDIERGLVEDRWFLAAHLSID